MRQERDKTDVGPEYEHIPQDAKGDPIFLILPAGVKAAYDRKMACCEAGWSATSDPLFVAEASTLARLHRQPVPAWFDDAVYDLAGERRTKAHAKSASEAAAKFMRYLTVRDAHAGGLSWEKAYAHAAEILTGTYAAGEPETVRSAYKAVKRDLRAGRGGRYCTPKEQNRSSLGEPTAGVPGKPRSP